MKSVFTFVMYRICCLIIVSLTLVYGFNDISDFRSQLLNGEIVVVNESTRIQPNSTHNGLLKTKLVKGQINYELGKRIPGDKIVAEKTDQQSFPSAKDVQIVLKYPTSGEGSILTYVNIVVDQSSNIGDGIVIDGGIEKRCIAILIEANNTLHFSYSGTFFGY